MLVSFLLLLISASLHLWGYLILLFSHISNNLLHFSISFSNFFQTSSTFSTLLIISIYFCLQVPWDRAHLLSTLSGSCLCTCPFFLPVTTENVYSSGLTPDATHSQSFKISVLSSFFLSCLFRLLQLSDIFSIHI